MGTKIQMCRVSQNRERQHSWSECTPMLSSLDMSLAVCCQLDGACSTTFRVSGRGSCGPAQELDTYCVGWASRSTTFGNKTQVSIDEIVDLFPHLKTLRLVGWSVRRCVGALALGVVTKTPKGKQKKRKTLQKGAKQRGKHHR